MTFKWDIAKAAANLKKHKVGFDEAATVFKDPLSKTFYDQAHSDEEDRDILVGHSQRGRLLIVSFTVRQPGVIRIISARIATRAERRDYEESQGY